MTKIKTSELQGAALDWAVASFVENLDAYPKEGGGFEIQRTQLDEFLEIGTEYSPSTDWSQGGPLIKNELITITPHTWDEGPALRCCWCAVKAIYGVFDGPKEHLNKKHYGPTPLIAACRAIVAAKMGDEVDVPEELV